MNQNSEHLAFSHYNRPATYSWISVEWEMSILARDTTLLFFCLPCQQVSATGKENCCPGRNTKDQFLSFSEMSSFQ